MKMTKRQFMASLTAILSAAVCSGVTADEAIAWADDGIDAFDEATSEDSSSESIASGGGTQLSLVEPDDDYVLVLTYEERAALRRALTEAKAMEDDQCRPTSD